MFYDFSLISISLSGRFIDSQKAEGVVAYFDANNIKAGNKFVHIGGPFGGLEDEEVSYH